MGATEQPRILSSLLYSGIALILYLAAWILPIPGIFLWLWTPLPLILLYWQRGLAAGRRGLVVALVAAFTVFIILDMTFLGFMFLYYAAIAVILGEAPAWRLKPDLALATAAVSASLILILALKIGGMLYGISLSEFWSQFSAANQAAMLKYYQDMGLDPEATAEMQTIVSHIITVVGKMSIALCLVGSMIAAWLNLLLGRVIMRRIYGPVEISDLGLTRWSTPEHLVWPLIAAGLGVALTDGFWFWACMNLLTILAMVYFMHGVAVIVFLMDKRKVPLVMRVVIFAVLTVEFFLAVLVALAGVFDTWFDFRRLKKAESAE